MFLLSMMLKLSLTLVTRATCNLSISLGYLLSHCLITWFYYQYACLSNSFSLGTVSSETHRSKAVDTRRDRLVKHVPFEMQGHFGSVPEPG